MFPCVAWSDQLVMTNGDVITGDISKIESEKVFIKPSYADEFSVSLAEVASIEADQVFEVEMADGRTMEGTFAGAADGEQSLIVDDQAMSIGVSEVASAVEPLVEPPVVWEGSGEFGLVTTTGNTETVKLNFGFNIVRTDENWRHRLSGTALNTSEDGVQDNERYTVELQSDRKLGEESWLFGAFRWDADKFGAYDPQYSLTAGYGRQLMKSDRHELRGEIGVGYRWLEETDTKISSDAPIIRFLLDDWWQIWASTRWTNRLLVETGSDNTFSQFNTGLAVSMTDRMAVKLGFEVRNNSKIPPGDSENTDTVTSVNLVYDF
jgi:putative salt-induced outer membrane protein